MQLLLQFFRGSPLRSVEFVVESLNSAAPASSPLLLLSVSPRPLALFLSCSRPPPPLSLSVSLLSSPLLSLSLCLSLSLSYLFLHISRYAEQGAPCDCMSCCRCTLLRRGGGLAWLARFSFMPA